MSRVTRLPHRYAELDVVFDLGSAEVRYVRVPDARVPPARDASRDSTLPLKKEI
jgi:hypothetical protein